MKILLLCQDVLGKSMAGPAIRYYEFAKALSLHHAVTLSIPNKTDLVEGSFQIHSREEFSTQQELKKCDVIITQRLQPIDAFFAKKNGVRIILDAYDPEPLEHLELFKSHKKSLKEHRHHQTLESFLFSFQMADSIICANSKQLDLWTGLLLSQNRINPASYEKDTSIKTLIDIVPFGHPASLIQKNGPGIKEKLGLKPTDKMMLWGGGIWNWFDPLTLIHAIDKLSKTDTPVHLVFMGIKHPNESIPEMKMAQDTIELAKKLNLFDRYVHFNFGWTPYQERQNYLLDADIGVSTHSEHIETRYAFRTRMLDYIWAELPILATTGDSFADLIHTHKLGVVTPYQDVDALVEGTRAILKSHAQFKNNFKSLNNQFAWNHLVQPIERMIAHFSSQPRPKISFSDTTTIMKVLYKSRGPKALYLKLKTLF